MHVLTLLTPFLAFAPGLAGPARGEAVSGFARAVDGDTLEVGGARVRLHGVDAPESAQECTDARGRAYACGRAAARRLAALDHLAGRRRLLLL